ncbi:sensor histidine kinase [Streptomyces sp. NRRL S-1868]|uniref:sensor histidine kinase n=1 Tax=Streptomyces sp. NRRL S-1868 TaxID=1463892 RepID=UPI00099B43E2|nr:histidine kinase [Streptomyces sp. NRRL S-1868]
MTDEEAPGAGPRQPGGESGPAGGHRPDAPAPRTGPWTRRWRRVPPAGVDAALVLLAFVDAYVPPFDLTAGNILSTAAACGALVLRRRFPLVVFLASLPAALLLDVVVAPIAALFTLADRSRDRRVMAACAFLFAAVSAVPWPLSAYTPDEQTWALVDFVYLLASAAAPVLLGQLVQARRDLSRQLAETEQAREHERALHAQAAVARERAQLAREMHDVVSHQVSLIAVRSAALQVAAHEAEAREAAGTIRALSVDTLDELRHMVTLLRASGGSGSELTPQPRLADLRRLVETSGVEAELTGCLPPDIGTPAQRTVYRTVQEALTNARKHAPGARATVELWRAEGRFGVTVVNTPPTRPGLPLPGSQQGLLGLRERAELLDAELTTGPTPEGGFLVRLSIPERHG